MPILHVRALPQRDSERIQDALMETCTAIAQAYGCERSQVWATWEEIQPGFYVEGRNAGEIQPDDTHPPIAQLICFEGKSADEIEQVLLAAAKALSESLGIPNNIFMSYLEMGSGRVVAGDAVVRKKCSLGTILGIPKGIP